MSESHPLYDINSTGYPSHTHHLPHVALDEFAGIPANHQKPHITTIPAPTSAPSFDPVLCSTYQHPYLSEQTISSATPW
jgi:hypothetical protein